MGVSQSCFCAFAVEAAKNCGRSMEWENQPLICVPEASKWRRLPWTESQRAFAKAGLSPLAGREMAEKRQRIMVRGKGDCNVLWRFLATIEEENSVYKAKLPMRRHGLFVGRCRIHERVLPWKAGAVGNDSRMSWEPIPESIAQKCSRCTELQPGTGAVTIPLLPQND